MHIATHCIDAAPADYCTICRYPRQDSICGRGLGCKDTTKVTEETKEFVVITDIKACGCPSGFVHDLVVPRMPVTGVEDPRKPADIWSVAWKAARTRIGDEGSIGLVVNPVKLRTQDQLHVHIVRLAGDAAKRLRADRRVHVSSLDHVWRAAAEKAAALRMEDYGLLVVRDGEEGFFVYVEAQSPEKAYTLWECR